MLPATFTRFTPKYFFEFLDFILLEEEGEDRVFFFLPDLPPLDRPKCRLFIFPAPVANFVLLSLGVCSQKCGRRALSKSAFGSLGSFCTLRTPPFGPHPLSPLLPPSKPSGFLPFFFGCGPRPSLFYLFCFFFFSFFSFFVCPFDIFHFFMKHFWVFPSFSSFLFFSSWGGGEGWGEGRGGEAGPLHGGPPRGRWGVEPKGFGLSPPPPPTPPL